ncbi:hypothetical protein EJB05_57728, partial [Eragrostis curvula]
MTASALFSAAGSGALSRAASGIVAKAARGFQVFRIDGYSLTGHLPGGKRITSPPFAVGGRNWYMDLYPNGADASRDDDSDAISVFLRLCGQNNTERVRAQYKFSLLDAAGNAAYELPPATATLQCLGHVQSQLSRYQWEESENPACGYDEFITKEELERRRDSLLKDDRLAVRCDVAVVQLETLNVAPKENNHHASRHDDGDWDYSDWEGAPEPRRRRQQRPPLDDQEYVRRCLSKSQGRRG